MKISDRQITLIDNYILEKIDKKELTNQFGKEYSFKEFDNVLSNSLLKDMGVYTNHIFNKVFWYLPVNVTVTEKDFIFKKYISIKFGHFEHENMLDYFHTNIINPVQNVSILNDLIRNPPEYFKLDDSEPVFLQKCLFIISKQPCSDAKNILKEYSISKKNTVLSLNSKLYLERLKENT